VTRLWDRLIHRDGYWEGQASGAAVLTTTYGSPDREAILPQLTAWAQASNAGNAVVFAAICARIRLLSEARFTLQRATDKGLFTNSSLSILQHPWPGGTEGDLLARMEQDASLAGNSFTWSVPDEDLLVRLRPDWTTIISELVDAPGGGQYRRKIGYWVEPPKTVLDQGRGEFYPAAEVAHWAPIPDPAASFRGMSWMTPVYRDITGDSGLITYKIKYLENSASPNLLVKYAAKLQDGTVDKIRERMHARHGGVDNAFKTLVLDQGADVTIIGNSLAQMDFANVQQAGTERILAAGMVPPLVVGLEPIKGAGKSYEQVMRHFADLWARPQWRSACGALESIVPGIPSAVRLWVDTGDIAALQDGEQVRAQVALVSMQALLTAVQAGYTRDSAVTAVDSGDITQLVPDPAAQAAPAAPTEVQHLLPQPGQPGATADPVPAGARPRLPVGSTSPADGGNQTRPVPQLAAGRRSATGPAGEDEPGDDDWADGDDLDLDELLADAETPEEGLEMAARFDQYHAPAGQPSGGQFSSAGAGGGSGGAKANGAAKAHGAKATAAGPRPAGEDTAEAKLQARAAADRAQARRLEAQLKALVAQMRTAVHAHHAATTAAHHAVHHHAAAQHRKTATHHHRHARSLHARISSLRTRIRGLLASARALDARVAAM
jgi:Phage portal protein